MHDNYTIFCCGMSLYKSTLSLFLPLATSIDAKTLTLISFRLIKHIVDAKSLNFHLLALV